MADRIDTFPDLQARAGEILDRLRATPALAIAAAANPLLAVERLGYRFDPGTRAGIGDRIRLGPTAAEKLAELRTTIARLVDRQVDPDDGPAVRRLLTDLDVLPASPGDRRSEGESGDSGARRLKGDPGQPDARRSEGEPGDSGARRSEGDPGQPDDRRPEGKLGNPDARRSEDDPGQPDARRPDTRPQPPEPDADDGEPDTDPPRWRPGGAGPDPLEPYRDRHPVMAPLLEYRRISARRPRFAPPQAFAAILDGAVTTPLTAVGGRLQSPPPGPDTHPR